MKRIITIIGARPQFIKAVPVSKELSKANIKEILVHTGQHYDYAMSEAFFDELEIPEPKHNLGVGSGSHALQTGEIMKRLEPVIIDERPDMVIIYGDTNSTLAGTITASKLHIPVAHVEAGLRSFNRDMPEEINRVLADHVAGLLFCPTNTAVKNLKAEGITKNVYHVGDVMYDAALQFSKKARERSTILSKLDLRPGGYILSTIHRGENTDDKVRLTNIFKALNVMVNEMPVVLPLHPRTDKMLNYFGINKLVEKINIIEPVGFLDMISLESNAKLIITDSGGVQKEAYFHKVPCVTLRDETEWTETVEAGWNILADPSTAEKVVESSRRMIGSLDNRGDIGEYGDGDASKKIVEVVSNV